MQVIFSDLAKVELDDAIAFYELEHQGLGKRFKSEVYSALQRIRQYPHAWAVERGDIRRYVLHVFPYKVLYSVETDHLFIIAIAHQHRRPDYWVK